jgi:selenide,water dikinase
MAVMLSSSKHSSASAVCANASSSTDVSGFGLLGHLTEILCPDLGAEIDLQSVPVINFAANTPRVLAETPWIANNYQYATSRIDVQASRPIHEMAFLFDPQTNGPLLITVAPEGIATLLSAGYIDIGQIIDKPVAIIR